MSEFPRTMVGGISMPRLIVGSNWFFGYAHTTSAQSRWNREMFDTPAKVADVVEVFARHGCNAFMSKPSEFTSEALKEVEQRTGVPMIWIATPDYFEKNDPDTWQRSVEFSKQVGATFCFPHQCVTDPLLDRVNRRLAPQLLDHLQVVRDFEMLPGLSTHAPEAITCADACEGAVETYIQLYNCAGFLMQVEVEWVHRVIHEAKKPVMTIKPLAAGRMTPLVGLTFVWNTLRDCDMVTIGTMSPYEAEEVIEMSLAILERRRPEVGLQVTRSKSVITG